MTKEETLKRWKVSGAVWTTPGGPDDGGIRIGGADRNEDRTTPCERDRNARLMSAAPELLASLKGMMVVAMELAPSCPSIVKTAENGNTVFTETPAMKAEPRFQAALLAIAHAEGLL